MTPAPGGLFHIKVTPPREIDMTGRIDVVLPYKRLATLHKISHIQFPPPSGANPQYIRPFATFPKPKLLGLGAKSDKVCGVLRLLCMNVSMPEHYRLLFVFLPSTMLLVYGFPQDMS